MAIKIILKRAIIEKEEDLIKRCLNEDRQAQALLYHRYKRGMLNVAYRMLNNEEDAKDVLQDSFIKAFRDLNQLKNIHGFGGWLKRIIVNTSINHLKKKGLRIVSLSDALENQITDTEVENQDLNWDVQIVREALLQLPDGYRTVLTLYLIEGYDHQEISEILGISKSTSLTQYSRGKKRLKQLVMNNYNH